MVTGYEVAAYRDLARIASALERIADALEPKEETPAPDPAE
jgi:hypothetical protein